MSRMIAIFLMLMLPLQAIAAVERQFAHSSAPLVEHLAAHDQHIPHHHDEHGDTLFDESPMSLAHALDFDHGSSVLAVAAWSTQVGTVPTRAILPPFRDRLIPDPARTPPLRPPHTPA